MIAADKVRSKLMFRLPRAVLPVRHGTVGAVDGGRHDGRLGGDHANQKKSSGYDTGGILVVKIGYKKSQVKRLPRPQKHAEALCSGCGE